MPVGPKFKFSLKKLAAYPNGYFVKRAKSHLVQLRPLRCRIVLPIAVKSRKLEFAQGWFPGFKGERFASPATIPFPPLVHFH